MTTVVYNDRRAHKLFMLKVFLRVFQTQLRNV